MFYPFTKKITFSMHVQSPGQLYAAENSYIFFIKAFKYAITLKKINI